MNCQQHDLAIIVNSATEEGKENIGQIVYCLHLENTEEGSAWAVASSGKPLVQRWRQNDRRIAIRRGSVTLIADEHLKPVSGISETAVDFQSLRKVGVKS